VDTFGLPAEADGLLAAASTEIVSERDIATVSAVANMNARSALSTVYAYYHILSVRALRAEIASRHKFERDKHKTQRKQSEKSVQNVLFKTKRNTMCRLI